jgi:mRNA interferase MazF
VVRCEDVLTIPTAALGRQVGMLLPDQERALAHTLSHAFDLATR